jgi:gluconolactonase
MNTEVYSSLVLALLLNAAATTALAQSPVIAPGAELQRIPGDFSFTEGPATDRFGNVYFTDQPNDRIMKWSAVEGKITTFLQPSGRSNGLYFDTDGNLLACADEENQLWSIALDGSVTVLVKDFEGKLLNGPNDLWVRPDGGIYFTDPLYKRRYWKRDPAMQQNGEHVYFIPPDRKTVKPVAMDFQKPNGIIGTPDGTTLYVADIGAGKTFAYDIQPDGSLSNKRLFCELGSDGMTLDTEGNVYLTGRGVTVFDKNGRQIEHIEVPERWTANVTFGGKDRRLLFITAGGSVYGLQMRVPGAQ